MADYKEKKSYKQRHGKSYQSEIEDFYQNFVGSLDVEGKILLREFSGDSFRLFKRMIGELMQNIETTIKEGKYPGYLNGEKLTEEQLKDIINIQEDMKIAQKKVVQKAWAYFLTKHKFGAFRLFEYISKNELPEKYAKAQNINPINIKKDDPKEDKAN